MPLEISSNPSFVPSPFGKRDRPPEEDMADGSKKPLSSGMSIPDFIRAIYKTQKVSPINAMFSFLSRDSKPRAYDWGKTDPFTMKGPSSLGQFNKDALDIIALLVDEWRKLGLPIKKDKDRHIDMPDSEEVADRLLNGKLKLDPVNYERVVFIMSNIDIMKKACIVRTVIPGWWVVSYDGNDSEHLKYFAPVIKTITDAFLAIQKMPSYKAVVSKILDEQGDPLDTNVGYPLFSSETSAEGVPIAKLQLINLFENVGVAGYDFSKWREAMAARVKDPLMRANLFAIGPIRRLQPGWKWQHKWKQSSVGFVLDVDTRGFTTNRVAWMAPYILNMALSPIQTEWKAIRKLVDGLFHDADFIKSSLDYIRQEKPFIIEADYSNYDRTIPVNVVSYFSKLMFKGRLHGSWMEALINQMHYEVPIMWSESISGYRGRGWIFTPNKIALLSGLKLTSEEGTFVNLICVCQSLLDAKVFTHSQLFDYITHRARTGKSNPHIRFLIQSDDTMLFTKSPVEMKPLRDAFVANSKRLGIKASVEIGDRFLMKHMTNGRHSPLASRVWQNTLSNEEPVDDELKFLVGLVTRSDGMYGVKTVDPFSTGTRVQITDTEKRVTDKVLQSIRGFLINASVVHRPAVSFVDGLLAISATMTKVGSNQYIANPTSIKLVSQMRIKAIQLLAEREAEKISASSSAQGPDSVVRSSLLYQLHKNRASPSSAAIIEELEKMDVRFKVAASVIGQKENKFYKYAMKHVGFPLLYP